MGFRIARVMRFYHMKLPEVLEMPRRHFYWASNQMERVEASERLAHLHLLMAAQSQEQFEAAQDRLNELRGEIEEYVVRTVHSGRVNVSAEPDDGSLDPEFDRHGLMELKALFGA